MYMYFQPRISDTQEEADIKAMIDKEYEREKQEESDYYKQIEEDYYKHLEEDMTQEYKELLLKDLCSRLPYKPIVQIDGCGIWNLRGIDHDDSAELRDSVIVWKGENYPSSKNSFPIINCKPYLFPLSSITEEQKNEYQHITERWMYDSSYSISDSIDWLNKNHFDYRGLIEKELAINATYLNIY